MPKDTPAIHLAVAFDGTGWHPASWREPDAKPAELLQAGYWVGLAQEAERGLLDFLTIEDGFRLQSDDPFRPDDRVDRVRGRLDATLIASRIAPVTERIGLIPTTVVTHTEPFHLSKAIATLDSVSGGRAGVRVQVDLSAEGAGHFGRRSPSLPPAALPVEDPAELDEWINDPFDEAADVVEVLRRLWDSWEDDAEIRDVATGRFIDRDKLHYIDFAGRWFSVRGPSITPRPPQGQPLVAALAHATIPYRLLARSADIGFVTPRDAADAAAIVAEVRREQELAGRADDTLHVVADLAVFLDDTEHAATVRKERLDERAGSAYTSDAQVFVGTPAQLADLIAEWSSDSGVSGFRLRPGTLPHDLTQITGGLVPELQRRGLFRTSSEADTLRGRLGLTRPSSRYATAAATQTV